jgi:hypothetical protein
MMRAFLVGIVFLALGAVSASPAFGQATGFVEKIGFGKTFRPYGWTPVLVNLTSTIGDPAEYQIQVRQEDLDRDRVIFRRDIVLNPGINGEKFWVYFLAQPKGLPENSAVDLDKVLDVRLCTKSGKPLVKLGIQDPIASLDPPRQGFTAQPGLKLVLFVIDGTGSRAAPAIREFADAVGVNETIYPVLVTPFDLPENVIGYDAVDAIVWLDADAGNMTSGGSRRLAAMTEYVRNGGRLVVSQPAERFKIEAFADLLPVQVKSAAGDWAIEMRDRTDLAPIWAPRPKNNEDPKESLATYHTFQLQGTQETDWLRVMSRGPFKVAAAQAKDDAVVDEWIDWANNGKDVTPWLARHAVGSGSVAWVAQDLGNRAITGTNSSGWAYVWDRVLGERNEKMRVGAELDNGNNDRNKQYALDNKARYSAQSTIDLGSAMLRGMEHEGRAGGLVFLAGVFFIGYWVVAGPVAYLVLAGKKRTELSWTIFAVCAMGATLLTVGVVRLVLRGDPEVHHVSLVRMLGEAPAEDGTPRSRATVTSRIGLYIPRDGVQQVTLLDNDKDAVSYITPYSIHPQHQAGSTDFPAYLEYEIPVRDTPLAEPVSVGIPYRSTLKKLGARWVGHVSGGIEIKPGSAANKPHLVSTGNKVPGPPGPDGKPTTIPLGTINGVLVNRTGVDLANVYFVFNYPQTESSREADLILYYPEWQQGKALDIGYEYNNKETATLPVPNTNYQIGLTATPTDAKKRSIRGEINAAGALNDWATWWYGGLKSSSVSDQFDDSRSDYIRSLPMLSLFDRIRPQENSPAVGGGFNSDRVEVVRRAAREFDVSGLVASGQLVILATGGKPGAIAASPLPFPLDVQGERVTGTGTTFYQFSLPLARNELPPPWAKPEDPSATSQPTTEPAAAAPAAQPAK